MGVRETSSRSDGSAGGLGEGVSLRRRLNFPLLTLYGLGVTVGAGIYVLVGATASRAGLYAPASFLLAALVVALTGFSYAELGVRFPVSAGEAAYVRNGLKSRPLTLVVGLMVAASGIVSSAAISIGAAGYLQHFIDVPTPFLVALVILAMGLAACWGILESVTLAAVFTVVELAGLLLVIGFALATHPGMLGELSRILPPFEIAAWSGILSAGLLAFFAFVGFEDIANVAEEVRNPERTLPRAIVATLLTATVLYIGVVTVVVLTVPMSELVGSGAPLALVFGDAEGPMGILFLAIAVFATVNGVLVQMIMASRMLYGLASQGSLPADAGGRILARVNPYTRTPLAATVFVVAAIALLALAFPIAGLAEMTARIVLAVFVLVNLSLIRLKLREDNSVWTGFKVPLAIPVAGLLTSLSLLIADLAIGR